MIAIFLILFISKIALADIYYVDTNIKNDRGDGSEAKPKKYIQSGISLMSENGGDTLILKDGTYSHKNDDMNWFVSGLPSNYNIIKSENDGAVIVTTDLNIKNTKYVQIEGLKFISQSQKSIQESNHIKIIRTAFEGGPMLDNTSILGIGTNDQGSPTEYILIEDCWVYGAGGRYNISVYKSDKVILRRLVLRHDIGWSNKLKPDPEGVVTIYNSNKIISQNIVLVDSQYNPNNKGSDWSVFSFVNNPASGGPSGDNSISGCIAINSYGTSIALDGYGDVLNTKITDCVMWKNLSINPFSSDPESRGVGISINGPDSTKNISATNLTIGNHLIGAAIWNNRAGKMSLDINNSIIFNNRSALSHDPKIRDVSNNCFDNNLENCLKDKRQSLNPFINGLSFLPRIEAGSPLSNLGIGKSRIGANVVFKIGQSGTLYGDPGYDQLTNESLWPWPNQERIRADMAAVDKRGFTSGSYSLTDYIWSALGKPTPNKF